MSTPDHLIEPPTAAPSAQRKNRRALKAVYQSYYEMREKPFALLPDPAFYFSSTKHRKALAKLRSGILNGAGTTLITGDIGAGKTTLVKHLILELLGEVSIGLINNTHPRFDNLLEWVLQAFEINVRDRSDVGLHRAFTGFVQEQVNQGYSALLFIDEAQNLSATVLEELRTLMNVNVDYPFFQLVLVGQPELRTILQQPDMRQFAQRIEVEHHLTSLDEEETAKYIRHRLLIAGGSPALFDPQACAQIHRRTHGVPRLINSLCHTALQYGYEVRTPIITGDIVRELLFEQGNGQLLALSEPDSATVAGDDSDEHDHAEQATAHLNGATRTASRLNPKSAAIGTSGPAERPRNLKDALKTLARLLD